MRARWTKWCEEYFEFQTLGATWRGEILGGLTTFLAMAYIVFVQPAVLSGAFLGMETGLEFGAVMTATCLAAAGATLFMGLYARYPIALAPGMGENFVFVFALIPAAAALPAVRSGIVSAWETALGVMVISGVIFVALSLSGVREQMLDAISPSLKNAIACGIGLFIAFIGLQNAGLIVKDPGTAVKLNTHLAGADLAVFCAGLAVAAACWARGVRGALVWGIVAATVCALGLRWIGEWLPAGWGGWPGFSREAVLFQRFAPAQSVFSRPPSMAPTRLKADVWAALTAPMIPFIVLFVFMDVFDTIGTLVGVCEQGGFIQHNRIPRAERVLVVDAAATVAGAAMGTSTVTSYIESAAGVAQGARTGMANVVTGLLFLLALFFAPVVRMAGGYAPITAPVLIIVGVMMMRNAARIEWDDPTEAVPAFLVMAGIPLTYSISDGIALGFVSAAFLRIILPGRRRDNTALYVTAVMLVLYFVAIRSKM